MCTYFYLHNDNFKGGAFSKSIFNFQKTKPNNRPSTFQPKKKLSDSNLFGVWG